MSEIIKGFVAVHCGAGYHSQKKADAYNHLAAQACQTATDLLNAGGSAREAVILAISCLEDDPLTNAGKGSNLTYSGTVECDASIMCGRSLNYGAVAAVSNVKNPIKLAHEILIYQEEKQSRLIGRIPPNILCDKGAKKFARDRHLDMVDMEDLIVPDTLKQHYKYAQLYKKELLRNVNTSAPPSKKPRFVNITENGIKTLDCEKNTSLNGEQNSQNPNSSVRYDTVGAICVDNNGNIVAGVSSGGILIKQPGRIGQAAIYGAGCWAESENFNGIGISTSGSGESLIKTNLAYNLATKWHNSDNIKTDLIPAFTSAFLKSRFVNDITGKFAGILGIKTRCQPNNNYELQLFGTFSSESFSIAYQQTKDKEATAVIYRKNENEDCSIFHNVFIL